MSKELIERLRADAESTDDIGLCADAAERIEELERDLLNLVCRIHRDGGHYIAKYGEAKAIADADTVAAQNNADLDALQADNAELVAALEDNWNCNQCETTRQQKAFDVAQSVLAKVRKP